jgi:hypothetical protein
MNKRRNLGIQLTDQISRTNELSDLLDFVQDIPEEKHEPLIINNSADLENIKSYAKKLERQNADLGTDNVVWQKACNKLKSKNENLGFENAACRKVCDELLERIDFLEDELKGLKIRFGI